MHHLLDHKQTNKRHNKHALLLAVLICYDGPRSARRTSDAACLLPLLRAAVKRSGKSRVVTFLSLTRSLVVEAAVSWSPPSSSLKTGPSNPHGPPGKMQA
mmetsp:Transcript_28778/g.46190  ORF Transcript_28778/g.46190 Transcript_28778/m.46190 type:complete len:100 (-) Transcript_28778:1146-1445(-)